MSDINIVYYFNQVERVYTYKFRLYPNKEQEIYLANVFGCCRLVYNNEQYEPDEWQRYNSARNVENSRGAVYQPFVKPKKTGEQTDSNEATIELLQD